MKINGPILMAIPLGYCDGDAFWARDMGLVVRGMRSLGVDARLVALGRRENHASDLPLILGSIEDFQNPLWWQKLKPWGIVLNTWSASRYNGIRRAALSATPRIIEKLDTDGVRSPRIWLWKYALKRFTELQDTDSLVKKLLSPAWTVLDVLIGYFLISPRIAGAMSVMPALAAETPIAAERMRRFMHLYFREIPRVFCIPHPVAEEYMRPDPSLTRKNRIVSVGRWHAHVKNFPLLLDVLEKFLADHPDWEADIVGELPRGWNPEARFGRLELRHRFHFHGFKPHQELSSVYNQSRIFLMSSRCESFNISAAEALCCGCSVVGPVEIASVLYFTGDASGTVACRQRPSHFLDALGAEVQAWETGLRNPELISQKWVAALGSVAVGKKTVECLESLPG